jgi:hypothetical protein
VVAKEISPDGRLLLHGDPTAIARAQACLAQVAEEQGRHLAVVEPPPALKAIPAAATAVPTRTLFGLAFTPEVGVADVAAVLAFIVASAAGWVALGQLKAMTRQVWGQLLLEIDRRWDDAAMEESRIAVLKAVEEVRKTKSRDGRTESEAQMFTEHLGRLWRDDLNEYRKLMRPVNLLETVAYASRRDYLSRSDVKQLLGPAIVRTGQIFGHYIAVTYGTQAYNEFSSLVEEVKKT